MKVGELFSRSNKIITFSVLVLVIFGSLMIASAEMGNSVGDTNYLTTIIIKQTVYAIVGLILYFYLTISKWIRKINLKVCFVIYWLIAFALFSCRAFGEINGAYAWIQLGSFATVQPSEFAKAFMIFYGAKLLSNTNKKEYRKTFLSFLGLSAIYFGIILVVQSDLGSAVVLLAICYCIALIPSRKEVKGIQKAMFFLMIVGIIIILFLLTPFATEIMKKIDDYRIARFLAAADPFLYRYDNGYHVIMSLVSFANGNVFGLGYGNSIHKYMNFPNPSNDFILAVIVEELGIVGFVGFIIFYLLLLVPLLIGSIKMGKTSSKITLFGCFIYLMTHFILNVGGVSAFIPLTGVPLLLISSGGSSLVACLICLGLAQNEIVYSKTVIRDESNSR